MNIAKTDFYDIKNIILKMVIDKRKLYDDSDSYILKWEKWWWVQNDN